MSSQVFAITLVLAVSAGLPSHVLMAGSQVFASMDQLEKLAQAETRMLGAFDDYIQKEEERLNYMEEVLDEIAKVHSRPEAQDSYDYVGHPLNAFNLIKRYVHKWSALFDALEDLTHQTGLRSTADQYKPILPHEADYDGALMSILRLQKVYNLRTADVSEGWMFHKRAEPLGHEHMYDLGVAALNKAHDHEIAEDWLRHGRNVERPPMADLSVVDELYRNVRDQNKEFREKLAAEGKTVAPTDPMILKYRELCQQSVYQPYVSKEYGQLFCFYHSPKNSYYTHKVEILQTSPEVNMVYDFLSDREAKMAREIGGKRLQRARVGLNEEATESDSRVGKLAFVWDEHHPLVAELSARVSDLTGLNTTYPTGEPLQIVNYGIGGQYDPHHDYDILRHQRPDSEEILATGDRIASFMVYLNDVDLGGATVFPLTGLHIKPKKNAAVFWYNYDQMGRGDRRTLHAGCPVIQGQKWIANKWIREYGQELVQPCMAVHDH